MTCNFNITPIIRPRGEGHVPIQNPTLKMTSTRIDLSFNTIARLADLADLAELLFPGNRNQQHAFLVVWLTLKWADHSMVPNLTEVAEKYGASKRTLERVRAKMRRLGLIDHVSRFNAQHGYREGWVFSGRFERSLGRLVERAAALKNSAVSSRDKDMLLLQFADARKSAAGDGARQIPDHEVNPK